MIFRNLYSIINIYYQVKWASLFDSSNIIIYAPNRLTKLSVIWEGFDGNNFLFFIFKKKFNIFLRKLKLIWDSLKLGIILSHYVNNGLQRFILNIFYTVKWGSAFDSSNITIYAPNRLTKLSVIWEVFFKKKIILGIIL